MEKLHFSCVAGQCLPDSLMMRRQVVVCGMETHVCVLQTVMELLAEGKQVFVVADAVSSRGEAAIGTTACSACVMPVRCW